MANKPTTLSPGMSMPPVVRMFGQPLDNSSVHNTMSEMESYVEGSPLAYEGQILICYHTDVDCKTRLYFIADGGLIPISADGGGHSREQVRLELSGSDFANGRATISDHYYSAQACFATINGVVYRCHIHQDESLAANSQCQLVFDEEDMGQWLEPTDQVIAYITITVI